MGRGRHGGDPRRGRPVVAPAAGVLLALLSLSLPAAAAPGVTVSPDKGPVGTEVSVEGGGFEPGDEVSLGWDGPGSTRTVTADETGKFQASLPVPELSHGPHQLVAATPSGEATARFVVTGQPSPGTTTTTVSPTTTTTTTPLTTTTTAPPTTTTTTAATTTTTAQPTTTTTSPPPTTRTTTAPTTEATVETTAPPPEPTTRTPNTTRATTNTGPSAAGGVADATVPPAESTNPTGSEGATSPPLDAELEVERFALLPNAAPAGAEVTLEADFNQAPAGSSILVVLDGRPLREPVPKAADVSMRWTVPDIPPANYEVALIADNRTLARTQFTVLQPTSAGFARGPFVVAGLVAVVLGLAAILLRPHDRSGSPLGATDAVYVWLARRRRQG